MNFAIFRRKFDEFILPEFQRNVQEMTKCHKMSRDLEKNCQKNSENVINLFQISEICEKFDFSFHFFNALQAKAPDYLAWLLGEAEEHARQGKLGAARVGGGSGYNSQADCEAECVSAASCRFFSYASSTSKCDLCSTCTDDHSYHASALAANRSWARSFDSFKRIEPALPALMPFALSLNGQQYELNDADWTAELGYVMYACLLYTSPSPRDA